MPQASCIPKGARKPDDILVPKGPASPRRRRCDESVLTIALRRHRNDRILCYIYAHGWDKSDFNLTMCRGFVPSLFWSLFMIFAIATFAGQNPIPQFSCHQNSWGLYMHLGVRLPYRILATWLFLPNVEYGPQVHVTRDSRILAGGSGINFCSS